jgi:hypothetical protein
MFQPLPLPPEPPKDVASADRAPEPVPVVAAEFAPPPLPPPPPTHSEGILQKGTEPPLPPVAVAVFDGSLGVVVVAVAG